MNINNITVTFKDLADGLRRIGTSAEDAGFSLDETMALINYCMMNRNISGATVGNILKTIFIKIKRNPRILMGAPEELGDTFNTVTSRLFLRFISKK